MKVKGRKNVLTKVLSSIVIITFLLTLTPSRASADAAQMVIGIIDWGIKILGSGSDHKKEKGENSSMTSMKRIQEFVIQSEAKNGNKLAFGSLYEKIEINPRSIVLTYNGTMNKKQTVFSLAFENNEQLGKVIFKGYLWWDDLAEYKNADKQLIRDYFKQYCNVDLGPVESDTVTSASPAVSYTPQRGDTIETVVKAMGRPDDQFNVKNNKGELVPGAEMIAYFFDDESVLVIGLAHGKVVEWRKYANTAGYKAYRAENAFAMK